MRRVVAIAGLSLVLAVLAPSTAPAAEARLYVVGQGGWDFLVGSDQFEDDAGFGGAIGVDFMGPAIEVSVQYSRHEASAALEAEVPSTINAEGDLTILALDVSGRYNIDLDVVRPYLLFGVGYYLLDWQAVLNRPIGGETKFEDEENAIGVNIGGGVEVRIGDHLTIGPDVRYHLAFTDKFNSIDEIEDTELEDVPDFVAVTGRVHIYF